MPNVIQPIRSRANILTKQWVSAVRAAGGGFQSNSVVIANNFVSVLVRKSYYSKVKYLLPMLGAGINAARVPLIDVLRVGAATNGNFIDADFSQSMGLQGNGSTKYLDSLLKSSQIGSGNNGGLGWWENNINLSGNVEPIGAYNTAGSERYVLDLRSSLQAFRWGAAASAASQASTAINGHYYGQRASAISRSLYLNGSSIGSDVVNEPATGVGDRNIIIVGADEGTITPWPGRGALAYLTDGTMTPGEIADFNGVLVNYLMVPTGKPQS